jgi:hypothetical protein
VTQRSEEFRALAQQSLDLARSLVHTQLEVFVNSLQLLGHLVDAPCEFAELVIAQHGSPRGEIPRPEGAVGLQERCHLGEEGAG